MTGDIMETVIGLAKREQNKTMQNLMRDSEYSEQTDIDSTLAMYIYYFLTNKSDKMPSYSYVDGLIKRTKNVENNATLLSLGYGVLVYFDEKSNGLFIQCDEKVSNLTTRVDIITTYDYIAYTVSPKKDYLTPINIEDLPRFNKNRIELMRKYFVGYNKRVEEAKDDHITKRDV